MRVGKSVIYLILTLYISIPLPAFAQKIFLASRLSFNSPLDNEFGPVMYKNNLVFISNRKNDWLKTTTDMNGKSLTDIYIAHLRKPGKFTNPQDFSHDINTRYYEGAVTFSKDGKKMYFTRTIDVSKKFNDMGGDSTFGLFSADLSNDGNWVNITPFPYNSSDYNIGFPFLTDDGRQLFFCSQDPRGEGGFDIWVSVNNNGQWETPENLGKKINTPENEVFPFLHTSGRLYFASRGHNGMGGLDIFYSESVKGQWQEPVALPSPFNSRYDDFGLIFNTELDTAFISSTRSGSMDIFILYSTLPVFTGCPAQEKNDYCFVFYDEGVANLDTTSFRYEWDMGDGIKIRAKEAEHCFTGPGNYTISLNVIDTLTGEINYNEASYDFTVEKIVQPYINAPDTAFVGVPVKFNGQETYLPQFKIDNYYWDFGDGSRAERPETSHVYNKPGTYKVQLGVTSKTTDEMLPEKKCIERPIIVIKRKN